LLKRTDAVSEDREGRYRRVADDVRLVAAAGENVVGLDRDDREQRHEDQRLGDDVDAEANVLHRARRRMARPVVGDPADDHERREDDAPVPAPAEREGHERDRHLGDQRRVGHQEIEQAREGEDRAEEVEEVEVRLADEANTVRDSDSGVGISDRALRALLRGRGIAHRRRGLAIAG